MDLLSQLRAAFMAKRRTQDFWIHCGLLLVLFSAFWPVTGWFFASTHDQSRLAHALIVLILAMSALVLYGGVQIKDVLTLNPTARRALLISYALLALQFIALKIAPSEWSGLFSLITIPAYCSALAAIFLFIFGESMQRLTLTGASTLCVFLLLSIWMQPLDWPLRHLAGEWSSWVLATLGKTVELGLVDSQSGPPKLIMLVDQHPFHVASECNGFGVILTSMLIALLLAIYRRLGAFDIAANLVAGLMVGFGFNVLRIVGIVLLAPSLMDHYMLMHEIVGGIMYWGCLLLVWFILNGPIREETNPAG